MILKDSHHLLFLSFISFNAIYYRFDNNAFIFNDFYYNISKLMFYLYSILDIYNKIIFINEKKDIIRNYEIIVHHLLVIILYHSDYYYTNDIIKHNYYNSIIIELSTLFLFAIKVFKLYNYKFLFIISWVLTRIIYYPYIFYNNIVYYSEYQPLINFLCFCIIINFNNIWTIQALLNKEYKNNKIAFCKGYSSIFLLIIPIIINYNHYNKSKVICYILINSLSTIINILEPLKNKYINLFENIQINLINNLCLIGLGISKITTFNVIILLNIFLFSIKYYLNINIYNIFICLILIKILYLYNYSIIFILLLIYAKINGLDKYKNKILMHFSSGMILALI